MYVFVRGRENWGRAAGMRVVDKWVVQRLKLETKRLKHVCHSTKLLGLLCFKLKIQH